jgi:hypothetical protein
VSADARSSLPAEAREQVMPVQKLPENQTAAHKALSHYRIITLSNWYFVFFFNLYKFSNRLNFEGEMFLGKKTECYYNKGGEYFSYRGINMAQLNKDPDKDIIQKEADHYQQKIAE